MKVEELMHKDPVCCRREDTLEAAARMMAEHDCGALPVVDDDRRLAGIVTDRDIVCRVVARGKDPRQSAVGEWMSVPTVTVRPEADVEECASLMEEHRVRRVPVVDRAGACVGLVSQAQIARHASEERTGRLLKGVSQPEPAATR